MGSEKSDGIVLVAEREGVLTVTLNRPAKLNTFDEAMIEAFGAAIERAHADTAIDVVIVNGNGRAFSAGMDVGLFTILREWGLHSTRARAFLRRAQSIFVERLEALEKPVICAIHGTCAGAGLELAIACDVRLASAEAKLSLPEVRLGVIPEAGGCHRLSRLIGLGRAKEMVMTGAAVEAAEAERIGLINQVVATPEALEEAALAYVARFRECGPRAVGLAKQVIDRAFGMEPRAGLDLEYMTGNTLYATDDAHEGYRAFVEKRAPEFRGR
jgi:enoyl-CoA hydratase/carnithine racemase